MNSFFDYVYYRITQLYHKWDGRVGTTAIVAISIFQTLVFVDIFTIVLRLLYDRNTTKEYVTVGKWIITVLMALIVIYNYKKYRQQYNKQRFLWKDEPKAQRFIKGVLIVILLILPWLPMIYIGMYW